MWKLFVIIFLSLIILSGCKSNQEEAVYIYWYEKTGNQIERLDSAHIKYKIKDGEIWIREEDLSKVVACCS